MINPPFAAPPGYLNAISPVGEKEAYWFIFSKGQLLVSQDKKRIPTIPCFKLKRSLYMGTLEGKHLFAAEADAIEEAPQGWYWSSLKALFSLLDDSFYAVAGRAMQLIDWDRTHAFCGCCGKETFPRANERCRECSSCGHLAYPKLAPAVAALIRKEDKILLARSHDFPDNFYSVLAGYVEPGETLEQAVCREIYEEAGLKVHNIHYFGSQPWPFSQSLMVAFTCDWLEGEIKIDPLELSDAAWFELSNLPNLPPPLSISRLLIDSHLLGNARLN